MNRGKLLSQFLDAQVAPFSWADNHCCHFAGRWVQALLGHDLLGLIPPASTRAGVAKNLARLGGHAQAISNALGSEPVSAPLLKLGDLVLAPLGDGTYTVGIVAGLSSAFLSEDNGVIYMRTPMDTVGWRL